MKRLLLLLGILCIALPAFGQAVRFGDQQSVTSIQTSGGPIYSVPNATINWCNFPANGAPCTNKALTYTDITLTTPCSTATQVTLSGSSSCVATTDPYGNWGVWVQAGTYTFTITIPNGNTIGPYTVTLSGGGSGGNILPTNNVFTGTNNFNGGLSIYGIPGVTYSGSLPPVVGDCAVFSSTSIAPIQVTDSGVCPGGGGSSGITASPQYELFMQPNTGSQATAQGASGISTDSTFSNLYLSGSSFIAGPNPWIDTMSYNMRPVVSDFTVTAAVNGTTSVAVSGGNIGLFKNGDGILIPGAGPANGISTPAAPTVTPSLIAGLDNLNNTVAAPSGGSTTYNYCISARSTGEGQTACSTTGSTAAGWPLGAITGTIGSLSRSGQTVTLTGISPGIPCSPGALIFVFNSSDASFSSTNKAVTCGSSSGLSTTLTYTQGWSSTKPIPSNSAGGSFSTNTASGGTVTVYSVNKLVLPTLATNTYQYLIYLSASAFRGFSRPGELGWTDFGAAAPSLGPWFSSNAPASATANSLATTIVSGGGTGTLTVANAATQTASGITAYFDDAPTFQNACTAATSLAGTGPGALSISAGGPSTSYYFNSHVVCGGLLTVFPKGNLVVNEGMEFPAAIFSGAMAGQGGFSPQFDWAQGSNVSVVDAYPGFIMGTPTRITQASFKVNANGLGITYTSGGNFNSQFDHSSCIIVGTDTVGQCIVLYGQGNFVGQFDTFETNAGAYGSSPVPIFLSRNDLPNADTAGSINMDHFFFVGRGFGLESNPLVGSNSKIIILNSYNQNVKNAPVFMIGTSNNPVIIIHGGQNDSSAMGLVANLDGVGLSAQLDTIPDNSGEAGGREGIIVGLPLGSIHATNMGAQPFLASATPTLGQNLNVEIWSNQCSGINMLCAPGTTYANQVNGNQQFFGYLDLPEIAVPTNPAAGTQRWFPNSATHLLDCHISTGASCAPSGGGGGINPPAGDIGGTTSSPTITGLEGLALPTLGASTGFLYDSSGTLSLSTSASNLTTGTLPHAQLPTLVSGDIPNNAANTSGTAANATAAATATTASNLIGCIGATAGDICYYTGSAWAKLAGEASSTQFLQETSSGVPSWATPAGSGNFTVSGLAQYQTVVATSSTGGQGAGPGTTGYSLISNGASSYPTFQQVSLTAGVTGLLPNANLANPSATINTQTCTLGSSCNIPFSVTGTPNSSLNGINFLPSTVNALGLVVTPSNPSSNNVKFEITGPSFGTVTHTTGSLGGGQQVYGSGATTSDVITVGGTLEASFSSGADICAKIGAAFTTLAATYNGGTVTVYGATGSQACASTPFGSYPANFNGNLVFGPNIQVQMSSAWALPSNLHIDGLSEHSVQSPVASAMGAVLQAATGFPTNTPLVTIGTSSTAQNTSITNIRITCETTAGVAIVGCEPLQSQGGQENSRIENVFLDGGDAFGLDVSTSNAQQGGVYKNITIGMNGVNNASSQCFRIGTNAASILIANSVFENISCSGGSNATEPTILGTVDAASVTIIGMHMEQGVTGLLIGSQKTSHAINVFGSQCSGTSGKPVTNCFQISSANASDGINFEGDYALSTANVTNLLVDSLTNGGTIPVATESSIGVYSRGKNNTILSTSNVIPSQLVVPVLGSYTVAGLPAGAYTNAIAVVTNGNTSSDCTVGGGTSRVFCQLVSGTWTALGGSGGGGGSPGGSTYATQYNSGGGTFGGVNSPSTNGVYNLIYNVTGSAPLAPSVSLGGVPVNTQSSATPSITQANDVQMVQTTNSTTSTATAIPAGSTLSASFAYVLCNTGTVVNTVTPTTSTINGNATIVLQGKPSGGNPSCYGSFMDSSNNYWAWESLPTDANGRLAAAGFPALTGDVTNSSGSLATTVSAINNTAFAGTSGHLVSFGAANIPADSGVVAANVVTQASNATTNQICTYTGANKICVPGTANIAMGGTAATSAAAGQVPNSSSTTAAAWTSAVTLGASGTPGSVTMGNATSGLLTLQPATGALGTVTVSIPAATDTLVNLAGTQTLTNKSISLAQINSGLTSGGVVCATSTTAISMTAALTSNVLPKGGGAGACPTNSSITDNGTTVTTTDAGGYVAPVFVANGTTAGFFDFAQGSTSAAVAPCNVANSWCVQAATAMTAGIETLDGTRGQGVQAAVGSSAALQDVNSGDANHSTTVTTSSATSVSSTSLCSTTNCPAGTYQVTAYLDVTTACSTTGTYSVSIIYTDDAASKTIVMPLQGTGATTTYGPTAITSSLALAATTNFAQGVLVVHSTGAASINYSTTATACGTGGPAAGKLYLSVFPIQ